MTDLVACLSSGKGTWSDVAAIIKAENWDRVFLITNDFGKENFSADADFILVNSFQDISKLKSDLVSIFKDKRLSFEVAAHLVSGTGKEHMAIISALFELGKGIRLVTSENDSLVLL